MASVADSHGPSAAGDGCQPLSPHDGSCQLLLSLPSVARLCLPSPGGPCGEGEAQRRGRATPGSASRGRRNDHRSEEHTSELQSQSNLVCRLLLEKKKYTCVAHEAAAPANPPFALRTKDPARRDPLGTDRSRHARQRASHNMHGVSGVVSARELYS